MFFIKEEPNNCDHLAKDLKFVKNIYEDNCSLWECQMCHKIIKRNFIFNQGEVSDGYHTFNELYHHRAVLFATICKMFRSKAWKSLKHHDGTMYDNMFIVGINTPQGQATYHYDLDPYWNKYFKDIKVLENAPEWDEHTPDEAIERIFSLVS